MDWNEIATEVLKAILPILATAVTAWVLVQIKVGWERVKNSRPDIIANISWLAETAVRIAEQLKGSGKLPSNEEAKAYACDYVERALKAQGVVVDLDPWIDLIADAVEAEVYRAKNKVSLPD